VRIGAEIESVAASTKAAKVVNSEREEDNILVDKVHSIRSVLLLGYQLDFIPAKSYK
jgi:hypothetical protein